jgi:hypothetical protein
MMDHVIHNLSRPICACKRNCAWDQRLAPAKDHSLTPVQESPIVNESTVALKSFSYPPGMIAASQTQEQQLDVLRKVGAGQMLERAEAVAWLSVAMLIALGYFRSWVPCYMFAGFIAIAAVSSRVTLANLRNAVRGDREGVRAHGIVEIAIKPDSESPSYFATTTEGGVRWKMEFLASAWKPAEGTFRAQLFHIRDVEWPVLLLVDDGIIIPRYKPSRL